MPASFNQLRVDKQSLRANNTKPKPCCRPRKQLSLAIGETALTSRSVQRKIEASKSLTLALECE